MKELFIMAYRLILSDEEYKNINTSVLFNNNLNFQLIFLAFLNRFTYFNDTVKQLDHADNSLDRITAKSPNSALSLEDMFSPVTQNDLETPKKLFLDVAFNKGENILLASEAGVGKTLISIEVAKSNEVKKALFITLEDYAEKQLPRYFEGLEAKNFKVIGLKEWDNLLDQLKVRIESEITNDLLMSEILGFSVSDLKKKRKQVLSDYGIKEERTINNLLAFELLMNQMKDSLFDFVCLDTLNALFENPSQITSKNVKLLLKIASNLGITFLILHHMNKKGEIAGSNSIQNGVDSTYILTRANQSNTLKETTLKLEEIKTRFSTISGPFYLKRIQGHL